MIKTLIVKQNKEGQLYLKFPKKLLEKLNWKTGDKIEWIRNENGSFTLKKE